MKDTEYRPEPLEAPDIAQEDIPETPAEAEAVLPVVLPDLSESRPVVTGEPMETPEAVPEDREVVLTYLQDPPREVVEYYLHKARLPRQGDAPAPAPAGSIDRQLAQAAEGKPEPPAPKRPGRRRRRRAILITLGILLLVAVIAVLVFHFTRSDAPDDSREPYPGYEQTATDQAITIPSCRARKDLRVELAAGHGEALTAEEVCPGESRHGDGGLRRVRHQRQRGHRHHLYQGRLRPHQPPRGGRGAELHRDPLG